MLHSHGEVFLDLDVLVLSVQLFSFHTEPFEHLLDVSVVLLILREVPEELLPFVLLDDLDQASSGKR